MSASDDFDNLAENATCLINSIETTRSMVKFIVTILFSSFLPNTQWSQLDKFEYKSMVNLS